MRESYSPCAVEQTTRHVPFPLYKADSHRTLAEGALFWEAVLGASYTLSPGYRQCYFYTGAP